MARVEQLDRDLKEVIDAVGWPETVLKAGRSCGRGNKTCGGGWEGCDEVCHATMESALGGASVDDFGSTAALAVELYHCFEGRPRGPHFDMVKAVEELYPKDVQGYKPPQRKDARTC